LNLTRLREATTAKLKLGAITVDKPVKLTVQLPANVHRDLLDYAEALARKRPTNHAYHVAVKREKFAH
jgi:hypothetical protein